MAESDDPMQGQARFFDGLSITSHHVAVTIADRHLIVELDDDRRRSYQIDNLVLCEKPTGMQPVRLRPHTDDGARIVIDKGPFTDTLIRQFPKLTVAEGSSKFRALLIGGISALVACIGLLVWFGVPIAAELLSNVYPRDSEIRLGEIARDQIISAFALENEENDEEVVCVPNADAMRGLDQIMHQLIKSGDLDYTYEITVIRSDMANAIALPGGQIVLFSDLLQMATSPEGLAGVLAHEIGHTEMHHGLRKMFYGIGLGQLIWLFGGGLDAPIDLLFQHSYSRQMEHDADLYALDLLGKAKVTSHDLAALLEKMSRQRTRNGLQNTIPEFLSSHPDTDGRSALFKEARLTGKVDIPYADWLAIENICRF